jgi:hypothetical protein
VYVQKTHSEHWPDARVQRRLWIPVPSEQFQRLPRIYFVTKVRLLARTSAGAQAYEQASHHASDVIRGIVNKNIAKPLDIKNFISKSNTSKSQPIKVEL